MPSSKDVGTEKDALLLRRALAVWLRARPEDHWNRVVRQGDQRPMADHPQAMAELRRLLAAREPLYAEAAHTVETSRLGIQGATRAVEGLLRRGKAARGRKVRRSRGGHPRR